MVWLIHQHDNVIWKECSHPYVYHIQTKSLKFYLFVSLITTDVFLLSSQGRKIPSSRPPGDEVYVGKYKLLKTIGKGNFAKVKLARHMPTGQDVRVCVCVFICA